MNSKLINIKVLLILLVSFVLVTSCEKEIDVNLNSVPPRIVVEGKVVKDSLAQVNITKTKDFYENNVFPAVSGAIITIADDKGNREILQQNADGLYVAKSIRGQVNTTYTMEVKFEDQVFTSSSRLSEPVDIISIQMYPIPTFDYGMPQVTYQDPPGVENYYRAIVYFNGIKMKIGNSVNDDENRDGRIIDHLIIVSDNDKIDDRKPVVGDTVLVELQSIDKGVYTYFDTMERMSMTENNPTSNIKGGCLGYFSAYSFDRKQIVVE